MMSKLAARIAALVAGGIFGAGLVIGGMARPTKVLGFLNLGGSWDPSLLFMMGGAIAVHALAQRWARRMERPLADAEFHLPQRRSIDPKLFVGSVIFGVGWGLSGYCPGPSVVALGSGALAPVLFVAALLAGNALAARWEQKTEAEPLPAEVR